MSTNRVEDIDEVISKHMKIIIDEILDAYGNVDSIVLAGGFGRGEGSSETSHAGKILPAKDYDLYVFTDSKISEDRYLDMMRRIHERLGYRTDWHVSVSPETFNVDIDTIPTRKLSRLPPDISTIDLKLASKVIYGRDLRPKISVSPSQITLSSGAIVLFNKAIGLLQQMDHTYFRHSPSGEAQASMRYECGKTFIEMCTALCIMAGNYVPLYSRRVNILAKIFSNKFAELERKLPDLPEKVAFFTQLKLNSELGIYDRDPMELWFETRRYFNEVLRYYMANFLNVGRSIPEMERFSDTMYRKMGSEFFREYLDYNLRSFKWYRRSFLPLLMFLGQIYDNLRFIVHVHRLKGKLHILPVFYWRSPIIKIFTASLLLLNAIQEDCSVDEGYLWKSYSYLRRAYPCYVVSDSPVGKWNDLREACVVAQKLYFTRRDKVVI